MAAVSGDSFPLFVISHPRFVERYDYVLRHIAERSAQVPVVVGMVGSEVLAAQPAAGHDGRLSSGQIGCALSHGAAYRQMLERGLDHAIVIEDDAFLPRDFDKVAQAVLAELRPGEIISFYNPTMQAQRMSISDAAPIAGGYRLLTPMEPRAMRTALCYAIHAEAARRIAEANTPVRFVADAFDKMYDRGLVQYLRLLSPSPVSIAAFKSTIGYVDRTSLRFRLSEVLNAVPIVAWLLRTRRRWLRGRRARNHILVDVPSPISRGNPSYEP